MTRMTLDANVARRLYDVTLPIELCDPSGRVLGDFFPRLNPKEWEPVGPELSDEELKSRTESTEWFSTAEVLAHLKTLEKK